jgi:hypothetical protein
MHQIVHLTDFVPQQFQLNALILAKNDIIAMMIQVFSIQVYIGQ